MTKTYSSPCWSSTYAHLPKHEGIEIRCLCISLHYNGKKRASDSSLDYPLWLETTALTLEFQMFVCKMKLTIGPSSWNCWAKTIRTFFLKYLTWDISLCRPLFPSSLIIFTPVRATEKLDTGQITFLATLLACEGRLEDSRTQAFRSLKYRD